MEIRRAMGLGTYTKDLPIFPVLIVAEFKLQVR